MNATFYLIAVALAAGMIITGCQSTNSPSAPPVTAAMTQSSTGQQTDMASLTAGRALFVGRCARCHALPAVGRHTAQQWPGIVAQMSKRAGLQSDERQAVLSYILAARAQ
jgi:mono/diheme cytochrome c family protein